jgi:hypothetical protein
LQTAILILVAAVAQAKPMQQVLTSKRQEANQEVVAAIVAAAILALKSNRSNKVDKGCEPAFHLN